MRDPLKKKSVALVFPDKRVMYAEVVEGSDETRTLEQFKAALGEFEAHEVPADAFPTTREFVGAWTWSGGRIEHDMTKAREIHRQRIRTARAPLLAALDVEFQRALESGASTSEIVAKKNALRDATRHPGIEAAKTVDELQKAWPL